MKPFNYPLPRFSVLYLVILVATGFIPMRIHADQTMEVGAAGWFQYGQIGHSSDPDFGKDFNSRTLYSSGAQISAKTSPSENLDAVAGLGVFYGHNLATGISSNGGYAPSFLAPYVSEANFTYHYIKTEESNLFLRGGLFAYDYNPDVQNLGLYLLRGPLYPGVLLSGFEMKNVLPVASLLGFQIHHQSGAFQQDFIVNSDIDFFPYFDLSPAYIANYSFGSALRIGAGVNFYHFISITDSLTNGKYDVVHSTYVDTAGGKNDSTLMGFSGTKLMVNSVYDIKALFGDQGRFGDEDLKIYAEVALFGLKNDGAYKKLYGDYLHRMPMMVGFNVPVFGYLDRLALEVEWYGSPVKDDLAGYNHTAGSYPSALPLKNDKGLYPNYKRDNWKWSLYGSRTIQSHVKISAQIANDHFRPGTYTGDGDNAPPGSQSLLITPKDWYIMSKVAYFF